MSTSKRPFFGRERELSILNELHRSRVASLVVIKGRRRIGKTRLIEEFGKSLRVLSFVGLPPEEKISAAQQRIHFANELERQVSARETRTDDWDNLFEALSLHVSTGKVLITLDEINWMGSKDPTFLAKLKTVWDTKLSKNPDLILILSGSMSAWIEENILSSTGFFGRVTLDMTLEELPLPECARFWAPLAEQVSSYEKFKVLSVTGGIPRYLELIQPDLSAEQNIERLCFRKEGILFNEFDRIFSDLFSRRADAYKRIVMQLMDGPASMEEILKGLGQPASGVISEYLDDLVETGYLARDHTWQIKTGRQSKLSRYRLCDNYIRFYLRYIEPKKATILRSKQVSLVSWHSIMGLQFENLVLNNRAEIYQRLKLDPREIVYDNSFFQTKAVGRKGCQIDLLIQTRFNNLYLCEIKFSAKEIGVSVIEEVKEKIQRISLPRGYSIRPVLIHVNGVTDAVTESEFFSEVIDFGELLSSF